MRRREFLAGTAGLAATMGLSSSGRAANGQRDDRPVRVAVVGLGNRGTALMRLLLAVPGARVTALCDLDEGRVARAAKLVTDAGGADPGRYTSADTGYRDLLKRDDVDAVLIATPTKWHCPMAIAAMEAGKHVGSEVPAGFDLDELWNLVRTKEKTSRRYMMLENYLYSRRNMMIWNMARAGTFGDAYYAECSYIHDCRFMLFKEDGSLDWWGDWVTKNYGNDYPTHALGPVCKWLGINAGDRLTHCSSMMSTPRVLKKYAEHRFGPDSPQAKLPWVQGEFTATLLRTAKGRLIRVDYDCNSPRPASIYYLIQGTKGVYDSRSGIYFDGEPERWDNVDKHLERHDHAYWRSRGQEAERAGHGGGDFFAIHDFVDMLRRDREPWIDVYDAATWSVIYHCSRQSIDRQGGSIEIPDFTAGRWQDPTWRRDHLEPV